MVEKTTKGGNQEVTRLLKAMIIQHTSRKATRKLNQTMTSPTETTETVVTHKKTPVLEAITLQAQPKVKALATTTTTVVVLRQRTLTRITIKDRECIKTLISKAITVIITTT